MAAAANLATEEKAATVVTAGKVDKVANVATVVKAVTTGAMEKVAKAAHFDLIISYRFYAFCAVGAVFLHITRGKRAARAAESGRG